MSIWHIYGGNRLTGSTRVQGAKNAVLPIMAASVLSGCETVLHNVPDLRDVTTTLRILQHLGCTAVRDGDTVRIDSRGMHCDFIPHALMRELRSSVIFLGAILARFGTARLSMPGGCELGPRPVNLHLDALRALGARNYDCAVVAIGGDLATSVVATLNLKELGVQTVVCKATDETQRRALEKIGADRVVVPERESGIKLAQSLTSSSILDFIELSPDCGIAELQTPPEWCGKSIRELDIRAKYGVNVIAVRENGKVHVTLDANRPLDDKLTLVLLGENDRLARVKP